MPFACLAEKLFSLFDAIKHGEYFDGNFVCTYSLDATYFWGFFALLALVFLVDAVDTIKHGKYRPYFRSLFYWPFFVVLSLEFVDQIVDLGGNKNSNVCILISQVPGMNCWQVLGVLVTYAVLSAAISYYINLYYFPYFLTSSRPRSNYHLRARDSYSSLDKSTQTEETGTRPARKRIDDIPTSGFVGCYSVPREWGYIPPDARIGSSGNPRDWWEPSPMERDLLFQAQWESGSSFESEGLREGIETAASVVNGSNTTHISEADATPFEQSEIIAASSSKTPELPAITTPACTTSETPAPFTPAFTTPPVFTCCNQIFRVRAEYNRHKRYHDKPVICPHCPRGFGTTKDLGRHINDIHERTKIWHCTEVTCKHSRTLGGKGFPRKDNWRRHMRDAHGVNAK